MFILGDDQVLFRRNASATGRHLLTVAASGWKQSESSSPAFEKVMWSIILAPLSAASIGETSRACPPNLRPTRRAVAASIK
jgi:hypothetical protein